MRLRRIKGADEMVQGSDFVIKDAKKHRGQWKEYFGNDHPLHLEIGMGKGKFLTTLALQNPDINYLGMERYTSVLIKGIAKLNAERESKENTGNIRLLCEDAAGICDMFEQNEVDRIYLNFSDPWPKERHAERRLTSSTFLAKYKEILKDDGELIFKTDNRSLFDFSVETIQAAHWQLVSVTYDLHHSEFAEGNVMTEYEEKFSAIGNPICRLVAKKPPENEI